MKNETNFGLQTMITGIENYPHDLIDRKQTSGLLMGLYTPKTLANLDSARQGPRNPVRIGKKIFYEKKALVEWVFNRFSL